MMKVQTIEDLLAVSLDAGSQVYVEEEDAVYEYQPESDDDAGAAQEGRVGPWVRTQECDHVIGLSDLKLYNTRTGKTRAILTDVVRMHELKGTWGMSWQYEDSEDLRLFKYCPLCGVALSDLGF